MPKQIKRGTYRITFKDGKQIIVGNNYKSWLTHATEYASWRFGRWSKGDMDRDQIAEHVERVEYSETEFVDDGGLKYATPDAYQEVIDEMAAKDQVQYKPYADLQFTSSTDDRVKLKKEIGRL